MQACDAHGNRRCTGGDRFSLEIRGVAADAVQVSANLATLVAGAPSWNNSLSCCCSGCRADLLQPHSLVMSVAPHRRTA